MVVKKCLKCKRIERIHAKGLCMNCYNTRWSKEKREKEVEDNGSGERI